MSHLFDKLNKYAGKYEISLQVWGPGKYTIYISKDGIDLWDRGGFETAEEAMKEAVNYLSRINKK